MNIINNLNLRNGNNQLLYILNNDWHDDIIFLQEIDCIAIREYFEQYNFNVDNIDGFIDYMFIFLSCKNKDSILTNIVKLKPDNLFYRENIVEIIKEVLSCINSVFEKFNFDNILKFVKANIDAILNNDIIMHCGYEFVKKNFARLSTNEIKQVVECMYPFYIARDIKDFKKFFKANKQVLQSFVEKYMTKEYLLVNIDKRSFEFHKAINNIDKDISKIDLELFNQLLKTYEDVLEEKDNAFQYHRILFDGYDILKELKSTLYNDKPIIISKIEKLLSEWIEKTGFKINREVDVKILEDYWQIKKEPYIDILQLTHMPVKYDDGTNKIISQFDYVDFIKDTTEKWQIDLIEMCRDERMHNEYYTHRIVSDISLFTNIQQIMFFKYFSVKDRKRQFFEIILSIMKEIKSKLSIKDDLQKDWRFLAELFWFIKDNDNSVHQKAYCSSFIFYSLGFIEKLLRAIVGKESNEEYANVMQLQLKQLLENEHVQLVLGKHHANALKYILSNDKGKYGKIGLDLRNNLVHQNKISPDIFEIILSRQILTYMTGIINSILVYYLKLNLVE
ncbi:MAG: hypothetical protein FWF56_01515 [Firmicutes bacterium]|nr:hypothetical protein [Bacillota bacterium]MCL1954012.1 hypothetical protein [Bacillota bacterium]